METTTNFQDKPDLSKTHITGFDKFKRKPKPEQ
jgi:hypothetical protein